MCGPTFESFEMKQSQASQGREQARGGYKKVILCPKYSWTRPWKDGSIAGRPQTIPQALKPFSLKTLSVSLTVERPLFMIALKGKAYKLIV